MKKLNRFTVNHTWVFALYIGGMFCMIVGTAVLMDLILPGTYGNVRALCQLFVGISWILSWILRGLYKTNRSLSINDMEKLDLQTYIGAVQQVYENKFGKE